MKRSMVALLLLIALSLSGCKGQKAASSANPVERFESDVKQETSTVVPNQSVDEESQPIEQQKPAEEEKPTAPAEEQKPAEEEKQTEPSEEQKPAEEQKPEEPPAEEQKDDPEIVKFWETVPEMSVDEALAILIEKDEQIRQSGELGVLSDEERMALYVLNVNYYKAKEKYGYSYDPDFKFPKEYSFEINLHVVADFSGDSKEYFVNHSWDDQLFSEGYRESFETEITVDQLSQSGTTPVTTLIGFSPYFEDYPRSPASNELEHPKGRIRLNFISTEEEPGYNRGEIQEIHRDIIRYYLSLKPVAYAVGPQFHIIIPYFDV